MTFMVFQSGCFLEDVSSVFNRHDFEVWLTNNEADQSLRRFISFFKSRKTLSSHDVFS